MLKNMNIGKKLILSFIIVALIASIGGVVGLVQLSSIDKSYSDALNNNGFVQGDIGNLNAALNKGGAVARDIILHKAQADKQASQDELTAIGAEVDAQLAKTKLRCTTPAEVELTKAIEDDMNIYRENRKESIELAFAGKPDEAFKSFHEKARPYLTKATEAGQQLMDLNIQLGNDVSVKLTKSGQMSNILIIGTIALGLIISTIFSIFISKGISKPVGEVQRVAHEMEKGNYDVELAYESNDEVGHLAKNMRTMMATTKGIIDDMGVALSQIADGDFNIVPHVSYVGIFDKLKVSMNRISVSLSETLGQINQASDQVSSGSEQVSSGAQALSQGATEQASSVEELAATINEISQQIKSNAENASQANKMVSNVSTEIGTSNQQMQEMISAMSDISRSSQEIGKVIKTIEDIAFQTNILALNAAVEAARAGAAGKGFAVVADEVRNLASKSAEAAKGTTSLIEGSIKAVENGTRIADQTAKSLIAVVGGAQSVSVTVDKISTASGEQANAISQVTMGIDQISSVVQTNSATAEESAAASEELSGQASMLKSLVGKFKLRNVEGRALSSASTKAFDNSSEEEHAGYSGDKY